MWCDVIEDIAPRVYIHPTTFHFTGDRDPVVRSRRENATSARFAGNTGALAPALRCDVTRLCCDVVRSLVAEREIALELRNRTRSGQLFVTLWKEIQGDSLNAKIHRIVVAQFIQQRRMPKRAFVQALQKIPLSWFGHENMPSWITSVENRNKYQRF